MLYDCTYMWNLKNKLYTKNRADWWICHGGGWEKK